MAADPAMPTLPGDGLRKLCRFLTIYGSGRTLFKVAGRLRLRPPLLGVRSRPADIGLIGCGQFGFATIGYFLLRRYGACIAACHDVDARAAGTLSRALRVNRVCASTEELLATPGQHASAIAFASSCENCPNVLLKALGSGRPILCSDVMPMPEFGSSGLIYFSPTDPASIGQALRAALLDPARAAASAAAALERSRDFDWSRSAGETWARIIELAARRAPAAGG